MDAARIEQFKKMAEADPENELAHFSLGKAYLQANQYAEAIACFQQVLAVNSENSKAYHFLATAQSQAGDTAGAIETLRDGYDIATAHGDIMPQKQMAALMKMLGVEPPEVQPRPTQARQPTAGQGQIVCSRCGREGPRMAERPFKGPLGEKVFVSVCPVCWQEWLGMGTKVINELGLDFTLPGHGDVFDQHMSEFMGLE